MALTTLALYDGSAARAARKLEQIGQPVPRATLEDWRDHRRAEQYAKIRDETAPAIQRQIAAQWEDSARRAVQLQERALARVEEELPNIPPRDLPGALRNISTTAAISIDKVMLARERPLPQTQGQRTLEELTRALVGLGVATLVDNPKTPRAVEATCEG
jgi:hypothetical protein